MPPTSRPTRTYRPDPPPGLLTLRALWHDEAGLTSVEYALILAVMALATFTVAELIGAQVKGSANHSANSVSVAN